MNEVREWLGSPPVQRLLQGRVDEMVLVGERCYAGKAIRYRSGRCCILLSVAHGQDLSELTLTLCHELAHCQVKRIRYHDADWRAAFAELVREAGELGLLNEAEVAAGVDAALHGPTSAGLRWREQHAAREREKKRHDRTQLQKLLDAGLRVGGVIAFVHRGGLVRGKVVRINRRTVSAVRRGGRMRYRVPFRRVIEVLPPDAR
ncbi:MAG: hypothetical protein J7M38_00925 [Armatimonadetes bacterium]|nr:hypothetical protein [Armatimonadota bacterium]